MIVREVMTPDVVTVTPEMSLRVAARRLAEHSITAMPVVDGSGRLVGVLSEADVMREALVPDQRAHLIDVHVGEGPDVHRVREVMSPHPVTVHPEDDLMDAVRLMTDSAFKSLPVVEEGHVVGVVSRKDVIAQIARSDEKVEAEVDDLVRTWGPDWTLEVVDGVVTFEGVDSEEDRRIARTLAATVSGVAGVRFR